MCSLYQQHITVCPEGFTVCIVLTSQLQTDMKASPTLQLFGTGPEGGKCCYNMMIKGDQCLPGSWHFQYLAAARGPASHALWNFSSCEGLQMKQWEHDSETDQFDRVFVYVCASQHDVYNWCQPWICFEPFLSSSVEPSIECNIKIPSYFVWG